MDGADYPDNPVLARVWRGGRVESQHRGAWVVVDSAGHVVDGAGAHDAAVYARSSIKSFQALPLCESGAADRFELSPAELALAVSSHNGEPDHTERVAALLERVGLGVTDLACGPHAPSDPETRVALAVRSEAPSALHNNCSGKHAGFLALAVHLNDDTSAYLDPDGPTQTLVRAAIAELTDAAPDELGRAIDGCSAPTYRLSLRSLAQGIARVANPAGLAAGRRAACERLTAAAAAHPELIAGRHKRLCTDLARVSRGRLFPKIGAEAVYVIGVRDADRGLAVKIDDGSRRGLHAVVVALIERFGWLGADELRELERWRERPMKNWAGLEVGAVEAVLA